MYIRRDYQYQNTIMFVAQEINMNANFQTMRQP